MKILIVGATGLIGGEVANALSANHEIISAGYSDDDGDVKVDLGSKTSIETMFQSIGKVDAVNSTAGLGLVDIHLEFINAEHRQIMAA